MKIRLHKKFHRQFATLKPAQAKRLRLALEVFEQDPYDDVLNNHQLSGGWSGYRSINFGGDWRAIYKEAGEEIIFTDLGTHHQLYGK